MEKVIANNWNALDRYEFPDWGRLGMEGVVFGRAAFCSDCSSKQHWVTRYYREVWSVELQAWDPTVWEVLVQCQRCRLNQQQRLVKATARMDREIGRYCSVRGSMLKWRPDFREHFAAGGKLICGKKDSQGKVHNCSLDMDENLYWARVAHGAGKFCPDCREVLLRKADMQSVIARRFRAETLPNLREELGLPAGEPIDWRNLD